MEYRIREFREKAGLSQEKLAEKSNVSRALISALESGSRTVTSTITLEKLSKALNIKVSDIFLE